VPEFTFNARAVLCSITGQSSAWADWQRDGNLILPGLFDYLAELECQIGREFDMYLALHRTTPTGQMGWLRNMYHALIQQLLWQDPVWYALIAAARPDQAWRLIAYPYIAKYARENNRTGFAHVDISIRRYLKYGQGENMVQAAFSLDSESPLGCTEVVPGFHHHFANWIQRLQDRGVDSGSTIEAKKDTYTAEDQRDFGTLTPVPCPKLGARITRSTIVHGSTKMAHTTRRVLFPWFLAIEADSQQLEVHEALSWEQVARCHRELRGPERESLGSKAREGTTVALRGAVMLASTSALGDALVGRRLWTDPKVLQERDIILGEDRTTAGAFICRTREKLVDAYQDAFASLEGRVKMLCGYKL
jgi:hypothetical protein